MFPNGLEPFRSGEHGDVIITETTTSIIVVRGEFHIARSFSHFGRSWSVEMKGRFHLLPPGTYIARGDALLLVVGSRR